MEHLSAAGYRCTSVGKMHTYPYEAPVGFHERHVIENKDRAHPDLPYFLDQWDKAIWIRGHQKPSRVTYRERDDYAERLGAFEWELPEDLHADNFVGNLARHWLETYPSTTTRSSSRSDSRAAPSARSSGPPPRALRDRPMPEAKRTQADLTRSPRLEELRTHHQANDHDAIVQLRTPRRTADRQRRHYFANVSSSTSRSVDPRRPRRARSPGQHRGGVHPDHGDALNDHGHSQKWTMYEPSVHVPGIIWGPAGSSPTSGSTASSRSWTSRPPCSSWRGSLRRSDGGTSLLLRCRAKSGKDVSTCSHARDAISPARR